MAADLRQRLERAHQTVLARRGGGAGGVLTMMAGESPERALSRAAAEGRSGSMLVMPAMADVSEWEATTRRHQMTLLAMAEQHLKDLSRQH